MTDKEKSKAYDAALEKARKELGICGSLDCDAAKQIFRFFPQLAESEDERIRKWLCNYFSSIEKVWIHGGDITCIDILQWLERQKEQKQEWSDEDVKIIGRLRSVVNECASYNDALDVNGDYCEGDYAKLDAWLKLLSSNRKKTNEDIAKLCSNEWNEEDERMLSRCVKSIESSKQFVDSDTFKKAKDNEIDWLENRVKCFHLIKQEWNEEDEKIIDDAYCWLCEYAGSLLQKNYGKSSMLYGIANKLKFLQPQYHGDVTMTEAYKMGKEAGEASSWKPSEEDLMMLEHIIGQYETGNKNSKVMGYLPRIEELDFLKKVFAIWKN